LVYFVGDLEGNYLAHDVTLQIDRVGAVHGVIGPYGRAVHIHPEVPGVGAVIECHKILIGFGISLKFEALQHTDELFSTFMLRRKGVETQRLFEWFDVPQFERLTYLVYVRGPHTDALVEVLKVHSGGSPWWTAAPAKIEAHPVEENERA
jgi:hypothetical protein